VKLKNPDGPPPRGKTSSKKKRKVRNEDNEEEEEDEEDEGAPQLLLANKWDLEKGADPTGWWISEKLDGVRYILLARLGLTH
jgi:DNA ligase 1